MEPSNQHEREIRAARNQALFRSVNEQMQAVNDALSAVSGSLAIACECADTTCIETLEIAADEYEAIRAEPRRFAVLPNHVYPDVENIVDEGAGYVVVEKIAAAGEEAEQLDERQAAGRDAR
jgi:hypothetical protein